MAAIRLVVIDDLHLRRLGILSVLDRESDIEIVGVAADVVTGRDVIGRFQPSVTLIGLAVADRTMTVIANELRRVAPKTKLIILSALSFEKYVRALGRIGIEGCVVRNAAPEELLRTIRGVAEGEVGAGCFDTSQDLDVDAEIAHGMSERELEVLQLVARGWLNSEIAEQLAVSVRTIEGHVMRARERLNARSRTDAVAVAARIGLLAWSDVTGRSDLRPPRPFG